MVIITLGNTIRQPSPSINVKPSLSPLVPSETCALLAQDTHPPVGCNSNGLFFCCLAGLSPVSSICVAVCKYFSGCKALALVLCVRRWLPPTFLVLMSPSQKCSMWLNSDIKSASSHVISRSDVATLGSLPVST